MQSTNTGKYVSERAEGDDTNEIGYRQSRENDQIDLKYGFERVKDTQERTGYLINMHSTEILNDDRRLVAALDMYFLQMDGSRYKTTVIYAPYLLLITREGHALEVAKFLGKKYSGQLLNVEHIQREDLDLANHLSGLKQNLLKLTFPNTTQMNKVKRDLNIAVKKNREREKANTYYMQMLSNSLSTAIRWEEDETGREGRAPNQNVDFYDYIVDMREHDVPYHVRVSIDLNIFCGTWYTVRCRGGVSSEERPVITPRPDIIDRPEPVVLAFDIETTKLPLKFPDAQTDQIMMISYMIDGQGYLITNREIISNDVDDFEYTPKPEFEGNFIVFNEPNELGLLQKFFDHILDVKPHIFVTYNGDFFDWPFVEARAAVYELDMRREIGFSKVNARDGNYLCRPAMHLDCLCWVKRDSYLPVGSHGLKAVAKSKLRYDPVELDPEEMCKMAVEQPQVLANYSVSDAVATYYLYMKYVHPFIFALATIIPLEPDEILRKGSGTLCESLLMKEAFNVNIVFPNKQIGELNKLSTDGHVLDSETYVGGHVEALESGVFRADISTRFRLDPDMIRQLQQNVDKVLEHAIVTEEGVPLDDVLNLEEVKQTIQGALQQLHDIPTRLEQPVIYHLDVGAMYPNIILTNRLQPSSMVSDSDCAACQYNRPEARCKRNMEWLWRGEMLPASRNEFQRIQQQLETEKFPPLFPGGAQRAFHELSREDQAAYEKKRLADYCRKAYKKTKVTRLETRTSTICQRENSFYVDTVRAFRDRRYEYKGLTKVAKAAVTAAVKSGDAGEIKAAKGREVLYDSLQLAHKCILNSFYGYVMRKGARWHSMPMAGIVCLTGSNIITKAREIIERVGRPLELDTDGIWCILPASFPQEVTFHTKHAKKKSINVSYPNAVLNTMVKDHFTNDQYHVLERPAAPSEGREEAEYSVRKENSIFFEVDGPYLAMVLPAAKEEGKRLKKRYAVFNFDGSLAELKGFEVKRRGELQLIKIFQSSVFEAFLQGSTLEQCYAAVAKIADYWLDVLYSKGHNMPDSELFELISENRSMSRKLEDYGQQKSTSISTAKRLAEFLGDQMVKDAGLACKFVISRKPEGAPVTERAIPLAIFQSEPSVRRHYLRRWLKDSTMGDADIRDVLDWGYYIERLGGTIQKIITIPAALQGLNNPVPRVQHPDWLHRKMLEKNDTLKQRRISEMFTARVEKPAPPSLTDVEDLVQSQSNGGTGTPGTSKRQRERSVEVPATAEPEPKTWREALGDPPSPGNTREELIEWIRFHKRKWRWQLEYRDRHYREGRRGSKRMRRDDGASTSATMTLATARATTLGGFLRKTQQSLIQQTWQIVQVLPVDDLGHFTVWAVVGEELHKVRLTVPRIFYVNQRTPVPSEPTEDGSSSGNKSMWKKVHRVLPRARPVHHLYQYIVPEQVFRDNRLGLLADLATPDIEGIYETQMTLEFRALLELGCLCGVQRSEARALAVLATKDLDTFTIQQLEMRPAASGVTYLKGALSATPTSGITLRKVFLYQHVSPTGKREMWGLFTPANRKALIIILDTVRTNQLPTVRNLYTSERIALLTAGTNTEDTLPPVDMTFDVFMEINAKQVYQRITRALTAYRDEKRGPTMLCLQTAIGVQKLNQLLPVCLEFPEIPIHIADDAALLSGLDWQRHGARSMIRHFLNLNRVLGMMLEQCRYFQLPLGNMPSDTVLFGADLFYARLLLRNNFVLWCSSGGRPDLGGREADDGRLLAEFEDSTSIVQNRAGLYRTVCVELTVESLAVSALLQASKVQELEGTSSAITFDTVPQASLEELITAVGGQPLSSYDETALCSQAFRVMRSLVNAWLREVSINRNVFADFQIVHFYRWVRSSRALLYDPALRRALNTLMRKLFLQIVAEFQRMKADIIYADFNRIIIDTGKRTVVDAIGYTDYVVQNIRSRELFHSVSLSFQQAWEFLLWIDPTNYGGVRANLPKEATSGSAEQPGTQVEDEQEEEELALEMNWSLSEQLPEARRCRENFENFLVSFLQAMAEGVTPASGLKRLACAAYAMVQKMHEGYARGADGPALEFVKAITRALQVTKDTDEELTGMRRNMLRLIGVGEFSEKAHWREAVKSYVLPEVICQACNHCRDLDLCKDTHRALKDGQQPVWLCAQCNVDYDNVEIEMRLLDVVQRKLMSYTLQDQRCIKCKQIKRENLAKHCPCTGAYENLISAADLRRLLQTFQALAHEYRMPILEETVQHVLQTQAA
ncbi:DNA polymerase epsilon catalytic subunit 1 [Anopheles darlingi]|uniref:DNA polymerase epsilon catalytic subunit 1 n=1 Tax=Anopheles darlingi TaxID=43151 RepID=UPI0021003013|nr:DNA polymerase epsilon catalytic subunit 1 [Anopheles darlingi]